jgi:hypothetical protein
MDGVAIMRIGTRALIIRATAAAIGFAVTGMVFHVAVARSQEAPVIAHDTVGGGYESPVSDWAARLGDRQRLKHYFLDESRDRLR